MAEAYLVGAYELPYRKAPDKSVAQMHGEAALGAVADAGLTLDDVDGYFCAGDATGLGPISMADYLNLDLRHLDSTELGGASYVAHVAHAAEAIRAGKCNVALITLAGRPRQGQRGGLPFPGPEGPWEIPFRPITTNVYAMAAQRHMYEYGTTVEQLAWIKVAAAHHAQYNPHAMLQKPVTVEEVLASPIIASPLRLLDCCVISDGGGAVIVARPEIARSLSRPRIGIKGAGESYKGQNGGAIDITWSGGRRSGATAFAEAGITSADIKYASIYDSFTITVLMTLEDLGFCERGQGGTFVSDGNLISGAGALPFNTDGGGLCNNHPSNRGGITKVIEAVRQLRGEAHRQVQVPGCDLALIHGTGGFLSSRHGSATLILERE